jgi:hypothetical protein
MFMSCTGNGKSIVGRVIVGCGFLALAVPRICAEETITVERIRDEMFVSRSLIRSLSVCYLETEFGFSAKKNGHAVNRTRRVDFCLSAARFRITASDFHEHSAGRNNVTSTERPIVYFDGDVLRKYWPRTRIVLERVADPARPPNVSSDSDYLGNLAFRPSPSSLDAEEVYYLPTSLNSTVFAVQSETEKVEDVECYVLRRTDTDTAGQDVIWLHQPTGWSLRKRVLQRPPNPNMQDSRLEIVCRQYREVSPGCWLPFEIESHVSRRLRDSDEYHLLMGKRIDVKSLMLNEIPDDTAFSPPELPGSMIESESTGARRYISGGEEILAEVVSAYAATPNQKDRVRPDLRTRRLERTGILVFSFAVGFLGCTLRIGRRRAARA